MNDAPSPLLARTRPATLTAIALTALTLVLWTAVAAPASAGWVQAVDTRWHFAMASHASPPLLHVARVLNVVGSTWVSVSLALLVAFGLWRRHARTRLRVWAGAVIPAYAVTLTGKLAYARPRPDDRLLEVPTASFPSAHATDAAMLGLTLVLLFAPTGARRRPWLLLAVAYALVMAWSRTVLRVHWLSDVSAGVCWGAACALWSVLLVGHPRASRTSLPDLSSS